LKGIKRIVSGAVLLVILFLLTRCEGLFQQKTPHDRLLARVHDRTLYISEMEGMFPEGIPPGDSTLIVQAYVNRWVREALLLYEAERNLPKDLNIDKLVRDYRASLIRNSYEQVVVEQLLDSTITKEELTDFYEKNKEQYQLERPILRCFFVKLPIPVPKTDSLIRFWSAPRGKNLQKLKTYCDRFAVAQRLRDSTWYTVDEIAGELPKNTLTADNVSSKREFRQTDGQYVYYFRLLELKNRKEIAPLGYIEEQARKFILHSRKIKVLEQKREDLFELGLRKNDVKIYY
jgi:hypothetical protein